MLKTYERDIRGFIKREGLQLQRQADCSGERGGGPCLSN
jgi:hypothetical protein